ncbi:MAG: BBP7 family outer membrane beta-barrel protein [Planctomycetaceae bacterium]|nr:BBP7 family outer membrane beta-barrel protein [Planctomycetaceae bacterium]
MDTKNSFLGFFNRHLQCTRMYLPICLILSPAIVQAQVRSKKPDRAVYQPRVIAPIQSDLMQLGNTRQSGDTGEPFQDESEFAFREFSRVKTLSLRNSKPVPNHTTSGEESAQLVETQLDDQAIKTGIPPLSKLQPLPLDDIESALPISTRSQTNSAIQQVGNTEIKLIPPKPVQLESPDQSAPQLQTTAPIEMGSLSPLHDATCDGCDGCGNNDLWSCDSMCCDGVDCHCGKAWHSIISDHFGSDRWFATTELMLMWRKGDRLPPLVTTGPAVDSDTAGELGQPGTEILFGEERTLHELRAGGRFTLGAWLDDRECQALVGRYWFAGRESTHYQTDFNETPVIARPFLNVTPSSSTEDTLLIAFPALRENGRISVSGNSDVFGADISVHQFLYGKYGATVDLVYGYQYMRLDEDLSISSTSTYVDTGGTVPAGTITDVNDSFNAISEFHGAQLGFASRYRERCWSFNSLIKFGFGSLNRTAKRSGKTSNTIGIDTDVTNTGLLVNDNNSGRTSDRTFGWIPELDVSIGYRITPKLDATFGYNLVAMTDAVRVSGTIDPDLAVNTSSVSPNDPARPSPDMRYSTFYIQGIHFGLQYGF